MHSTKQKVSDAAAVAKEHVELLKAKAQEKAEKAAARTKEEKEMAHERRKAKEAEAKMKMHEAKAEHAAEKLHEKHTHGVYGHHHHHHHHGAAGGGTHGHQEPVGFAVPPASATAPTYPLGGHPPGWVDPK
ncbi:hypothetical protein CDL12_29818 [Handroanthus impetiginosus]|uniref:Uncharacterized protein n=1 Tax=Handroanthus impetiginosus TaxID=429701 RepID=A0A2G9FXC6_9LAMI|nr:hypothetical protein CDL12_29818 [Handroanthus impetiginosus]